jgi:uncharacterized membrane protein YvlD (DUF360 family)
LPLTLLTFGLFLIIVNALLQEITDALSTISMIDDSLLSAIFAAIILRFATMSRLDFARALRVAPAVAT